MLELYHNDMSTCAQKVRVTLAEKDLAWDGHELNLRTGEQHKPQFLKLNPRGVVPVLVHDGNVIIESNIIMEYVEDAFPDTKRLMPKSAPSKAAVRNLLQRLDTTLHCRVVQLECLIVLMNSGRVPRCRAVRRWLEIVPACPRWVEAAACRYEYRAGIKRLARWRRADAGRSRLSSVHVPLRAPAHDRDLVALPSLGLLVRRSWSRNAMPTLIVAICRCARSPPSGRNTG